MAQICKCGHRKNSHYKKLIKVEPSTGVSGITPLGKTYYTTSTRMIKDTYDKCSKCKCGGYN